MASSFQSNATQRRQTEVLSGRSSVGLANASASDPVGGNGSNAEPTVSSSLEHLVSSSQGVITKRIDLALLEGRELISRSLESAALAGAGVVLATAAWFAAAAAGVLFILPDASSAVRLACFGLLNGSIAAVLVALARRRGRPPEDAAAAA